MARAATVTTVATTTTTATAITVTIAATATTTSAATATVTAAITTSTTVATTTTGTCFPALVRPAFTVLRWTRVVVITTLAQLGARTIFAAWAVVTTRTVFAGSIVTRAILARRTVFTRALGAFFTRRTLTCFDRNNDHAVQAFARFRHDVIFQGSA